MSRPADRVTEVPRERAERGDSFTVPNGYYKTRAGLLNTTCLLVPIRTKRTTTATAACAARRSG